MPLHPRQQLGAHRLLDRAPVRQRKNHERRRLLGIKIRRRIVKARSAHRSPFPLLERLRINTDRLCRRGENEKDAQCSRQCNQSHQFDYAHSELKSQLLPDVFVPLKKIESGGQLRLTFARRRIKLARCPHRYLRSRPLRARSIHRRMVERSDGTPSSPAPVAPARRFSSNFSPISASIQVLPPSNSSRARISVPAPASSGTSARPMRRTSSKPPVFATPPLRCWRAATSPSTTSSSPCATSKPPLKAADSSTTPRSPNGRSSAAGCTVDHARCWHLRRPVAHLPRQRSGNRYSPSSFTNCWSHSPTPSSVPVTLLRFPRLSSKTPPYLFAKLQPILFDISEEQFRTALPLKRPPAPIWSTPSTKTTANPPLWPSSKIRRHFCYD